MDDMQCAVAADTKLETPEGPMTMAGVAKTPVAVLTRGDDGQVRFAMTREARRVGEGQAVLRIRLASGRAFRVAPGQVLLASGMREVRAADVRPGDELETVFAFPAGYTYRTDDGQEVTSTGCVRVEAVEPAGEADVYAFRVNFTGRFALSAGVLARAEGS